MATMSPLYRPAFGGAAATSHRPAPAPAVKAETIHEEHLKQLFTGTALCVRIAGAATPEQCKTIARSLQEDARRGTYEGVPTVGRVSRSLYETAISPELNEEYWRQSLDGFLLNRRAASPHPYPIDQLRLELDEKWAKPCRLLRLSQGTAYAGLARILTTQGEIEPHQDVLGWDAPDELQAHDIVGQLAANYYLAPAEEGGYLELWDFRLTYSEYQARLKGYGLDRRHLGPPAITIKPEAGELVLFDSTKVHAVTAVEGEATRVTASCFIGLTRAGELAVWS